MANNYQNLVFNGLGDFTWSVPEAGNYVVKGKISLPTIVGGAGASAVLPVIKLNSSTKYTGTAGDEGFYVNVTGAAVGDVIHINLMSSADPDQSLNVIKTTVSISETF